jgi:hypothetical protein
VGEHYRIPQAARRGNRDFIADAEFAAEAHARRAVGNRGADDQRRRVLRFLLLGKLVLHTAIESTAVESKRPGRGRLVRYTKLYGGQGPRSTAEETTAGQLNERTH